MEETVDELKEIILREQLLEGAPEGLKVFLKERNLKSWAQLLELAENYREAHGTKTLEVTKTG